MKHKPESIAYNIEQGVPAKHLTSLRLILPIKGIQYVFIDNTLDDHLRKTSMPLHKDYLGNIYVRGEDVKSFVRSELMMKT